MTQACHRIRCSLHPGIILSRPVVVKQLPGPSLLKLVGQFNIDVDSGIIRTISQVVFAHIVPVSEYMMQLLPQVITMVVQ